MDPLEAILASMAKATGNAPVPAATADSLPKSSKKSDAKAANTKKRDREAKDSEEEDTLHFPNADVGGSGIWNARVMQKLSDSILQQREKAAKKYLITPPMEISRQQTVRMLCNRIKRASEEMGIAKLPNSTYETWQFTSKLTVAEVCYNHSYATRATRQRLT